MTNRKYKKNKKEDFTFLNDMGNNKLVMTTEDHVYKFINTFFLAFILLMLLTINFIALSTSLNINKDKPTFTKYSVALVAFFFGLIYMIVSVYYYRITIQKEPIIFDKNKLFPFD